MRNVRTPQGGDFFLTHTVYTKLRKRNSTVAHIHVINTLLLNSAKGS